MRAGYPVLLGSPGKRAITTRRSGEVRPVGQQWVDGGGAFYPLGGTLFWALRGFRYEIERLRLNQQFLAANGCDYQRILGSVDWAGNDIDWRWAMTEEVLGNFLDESFGRFGLRSSVSLLGSALQSDTEAVEMTEHFWDVASRRPHTILDVDCANEANQNRVSLTTVQKMAIALRVAGYEGILALTDVEHSGVRWDDVKAGALLVSGADSLTSHPDRAQAEDGCRFMRQPYDFRDMLHTVHLEEPIGPLSSVADSSDALQLAMLRAVGIVHGEGAFCIHNGAGVFGVPNRNRPANLWEVPGIVEIMRAIKNVDIIIPLGCSEGDHHNNDWTNPFRVTSIWPEDGHGANRRYCVEQPWGFVCPTFGVVQPAKYLCHSTSHVEAFDPVLGMVVQESDVPAGGMITLIPRTLDHAGHGGLIIVGTYI